MEFLLDIIPIYRSSVSCLFLICQFHIIAELVHHFHEGPVDDLLTMVILGSSGVAIDIKA